MQIVNKDEKRVPTGTEAQLILGKSAVYKVFAVKIILEFNVQVLRLLIIVIFILFRLG